MEGEDARRNAAIVVGCARDRLGGSDASTAAAPRGRYEWNARAAAPRVRRRFGLPSFGVPLASLSGTPAARQQKNLPLAQKISIGTPVVGKPTNTGPVLAPKNAKAEQFRKMAIKGDGRCMFRALVLGLALAKGKHVGARSEETEADTLRVAAAEALCRSSKIADDRFADSVMNVTSEYGTIDEYCHLVRTPDFWGGNAELMVLSDVLTQPITVYRPEREVRGKGSGYVPMVFYGLEHKKRKEGAKPKPTINLVYSSGNHYDLLVR